VKSFLATCQNKGVSIESSTLSVAHSFERHSLTTTSISGKVLVLTKAGAQGRVDAGWAVELERAELRDEGMLGCVIMVDRERSAICSVEVFEDGAEECGGEVAQSMVGSNGNGEVHTVVIRPTLGFLAR
jgi:hypothetical protein